MLNFLKPTKVKIILAVSIFVVLFLISIFGRQGCGDMSSGESPPCALEPYPIFKWVIRVWELPEFLVVSLISPYKSSNWSQFIYYNYSIRFLITLTCRIIFIYLLSCMIVFLRNKIKERFKN